MGNLGRNTPVLADGGKTLYIPVAANAVIPEGVLVAVNDKGYAVEATETTGFTICGRSDDYVDNAGGVDGAVFINVKRGVFYWENDNVAQKDLMKECHIKDSVTVSVLSTDTKIPVGKVIGFEDGYVIVETV